MKMDKKTIHLLLCWAIIGLGRILMVNSFPIIACPDAGMDDGLMIDRALALVKMDWLGEYNYLTLSKGPFLSMIIAFCCISGIPYLTMESLLYVFGCFIFVWGVKPAFKKNTLLTIIYIFMLFNPASMSAEIFQRVYRNGVVMGFELMVIGGLIAVFLRYKQNSRGWIKWLIIVGCALVASLYTRDDSIWLLPFVVCATVIVFILTIKENGIKSRTAWKRTGVLLIPIYIYIVVTIVISAVNYRVYGIYTITDTSGTYYAKVIKTMYSIKDEEDIPYVSVSREKLKRLYEVSPTLDSINPGLENLLDNWDVFGRNPGDGEVEDGWFYWAFRQAVGYYGYYSDAKKSEAFYKSVYEELQTAVKSGKLDTRATMPSSLMSPWRKQYGKELATAMKQANTYVTNFDGLAMAAGSAYNIALNSERINIAETLTHNPAIYDRNVYTERSQTVYIGYAEKMWHYINYIFTFYQRNNKYVYRISIVIFILLLVDTIFGIVRKKYTYVPLCVISIGIVLSYLLFLVGVSYTHISAFPAIAYMYLSCAYPLVLATEGLMLMYLYDKIAEYCNKIIGMRRKKYGADNFDALLK